MQLAVKFEEIELPPIRLYEKCTRYAYSKDQIIEAEYQLTKALQWRLCPVTFSARANDALFEWDCTVNALTSREDNKLSVDELKALMALRVRVRHPEPYWLYRRIMGVVDALLMDTEHYAFEFHLLSLAVIAAGMALEWEKRQRGK